MIEPREAGKLLTTQATVKRCFLSAHAAAKAIANVVSQKVGVRLLSVKPLR
jgi:hypothetical protein